jgi:acylglycerol lipase
VVPAERARRLPRALAGEARALSVAVDHRDWDVGTGVRGYAWDAADPRAVLLLQHGFGEYALRYVERYCTLVPHLLRIGVSVRAFDLRGHGHSPGRRALTDVEESVADHLAARRELAAQPLPVFLLGHSLGGIVTATSVVRDASHVSGVILSSPALLVTANALTRLFAKVVSAVAPALPVKFLPPTGISRVAEQVQAFVADPMVYHGGMPARLAASILFASRDNWARYPAWRVPTLVMHGTADSFTEPEGSRRFVDSITSLDKTLHVVDGGYHELLNDVDAEATMGAVLSWVERRLVSSDGVTRIAKGERGLR